MAKVMKAMVRKALSQLLGAALIGSYVLSPASAADKVTFLTSWFAQAEHGGFYQAKATGLYEKAGLDVTIKTGGPQVNGTQLLLAGDADFIMGYDIQVLKGREQKLPLVTVASSFQFDLQGIMAHDDVADLRASTRSRLGRPISTPCSISKRAWSPPSRSSSSAASGAFALPVAGSSQVPASGANIRARSLSPVRE